MYIGLHMIYHLFFSDFNENWIFFESFSKNPQISNVMKIHPVEAELFHADRRTDMTKQFCERAQRPTCANEDNVNLLRYKSCKPPTCFGHPS